MNYLEIFNKIIDLIDTETDPLIIKEKLLEFHPYDLAQVIIDLSEEKRQIIYQSLTEKELADIFSYLEDEDTVHILSELSRSKSVKILENMEVDDAADVLNEMEDSSVVQEYLNLLNKETKNELSYLTSYQEYTVGSIMTTNFIEFNCEFDVKQAMKKLVSEANETETIDPLYVTDNKRNLVGVINLKDLIIARSPKIIKEIMMKNYITVNVNDDVVDAANIMREYGLTTIPVLDNNTLVGIITVDDAIDVIEDEVTYQYGNLAGVINDTDEDISIFQQFLNRLPWLLILLVLGLIISYIIDEYKGVISQVIALVLFQTLILDMAGNVGTQSLAVTIRSLGRDDLESRKEIHNHIFKEFKIILINSVILGLLAFIVSFIFLSIKNYQDISIFLLCLVVSISMSITIIFSGLIGVAFPLLFYKIKIDPAIASGPFITTLNDIIAIIVYFNIAILFLGLIK